MSQGGTNNYGEPRGRNQRHDELRGLSIKFYETIRDDTIDCDKPGGQLELPVMDLDDTIN